jgi:hypothetical protein
MGSTRDDTHFVARRGELNRQVTANGTRTENGDFQRTPQSMARLSLIH